jgi:hypothetical protein
MPDWRKDIREAIINLKLDAADEERIVEELAQHLSDRYEELLTSGMNDEDVRPLLMEELKDGKLVAELRPLSVARLLQFPLVLTDRSLSWLG